MAQTQTLFPHGDQQKPVKCPLCPSSLPASSLPASPAPPTNSPARILDFHFLRWTTARRQTTCIPHWTVGCLSGLSMWPSSHSSWQGRWICLLLGSGQKKWCFEVVNCRTCKRFRFSKYICIYTDTLLQVYCLRIIIPSWCEVSQCFVVEPNIHNWPKRRYSRVGIIRIKSRLFLKPLPCQPSKIS